MALKVCVTKGKRMLDRPRPTHRGFDVPADQVGVSKWLGSDGRPVTVYAQTGNAGAATLASDIARNRIDDIMKFCDDACQVKGGSGNVIIQSGSSGAYHYGCDFVSGGDWYEDDFGASGPSSVNNGGLTTGLVMAEVIESYMGLQNAGWNCGGSGGEALSRIFAETASGGIAGAMSGGFSARSSYDGSDWISQDQGSDQDYPSIGCGMLYLDWVRKLGFTLQQITQAGEPSGTLASNYAKLTGKPASQAFADFTAAVGAVDINATNPFNITDTPFPGGTTPPPPPPPSSLGALTLASALSPGTYNVVDSAGTAVASLTASQSVSPGTYAISAGGQSVSFSASVSLGTYSVASIGPLSVTGAISPGAAYTLTTAAAGGSVKVDANALSKLIDQWHAEDAKHVTTLDNPLMVFGHEAIQELSVWSNANKTGAITIPPFILVLLKFLCLLAPTLPAPYGPIAAGLCALLPHGERCK